MDSMNISDEVLEVAMPFVESFMVRRGFSLRGKEADALISYVLQSAGPHLMAQTVEEVTQVIAAEFEKSNETTGEIITRFQNAESAARKIVTNPYRSQA